MYLAELPSVYTRKGKKNISEIWNSSQTIQTKSSKLLMQGSNEYTNREEAPGTTQMRKKPLGQNNKIDKDIIIYKKIHHITQKKNPSKPSNHHIISKFQRKELKARTQNQLIQLHFFLFQTENHNPKTLNSKYRQNKTNPSTIPNSINKIRSKYQTKLIKPYTTKISTLGRKIKTQRTIFKEPKRVKQIHIWYQNPKRESFPSQNQNHQNSENQQNKTTPSFNLQIKPNLPTKLLNPAKNSSLKEKEKRIKIPRPKIQPTHNINKHKHTK